jgi:DNA polymerase/3'-5' exonuclease PolX
MSDKPRWPAGIARQVANELLAEMHPCCERVRIAGSLRRRQPDVGDIEILYVPHIGQGRVPGELFGRRSSLADQLFDQWLTKDVITKRPNLNGGTTWGGQNKLAVHVASSILVDLFATTAEQWFVSTVVRTGSKDMNIRLATNAKKRGTQLEAYGGLIDVNGTRIYPQSEREVFVRSRRTLSGPHRR